MNLVPLRATPFHDLVGDYGDCIGLQPNWDGEGAAPPSDAALATGWRVLHCYPNAYEIGEHPNGGLMFYWRTEDSTLTLQINANGVIDGRLFVFGEYRGAQNHEECHDVMTVGDIAGLLARLQEHS